LTCDVERVKRSSLLQAALERYNGGSRLIYTMKEQLKSWNRETTLAFVSMMVASYAWIVMEKFLVAVAIGIAMHAIQVLVYEFLARRFGWEQLEIAQAFHKHVFPRFVRLFSKTQRA